jgi:phosphoglycerate dehydrogenase-like enzyme
VPPSLASFFLLKKLTKIISVRYIVSFFETERGVQMERFRVGLTRDFLNPDGDLALGDIGLEKLKSVNGVSTDFFPEHLPEVTSAQIDGYDAVISLAPRYTPATLAATKSRLACIARFGVGYDMVDLEALTQHDVILTITPDGVRRPMATAIVTLLLALAHELFTKDRLVREGRWQERTSIRATGLTGRVFGSIGLGNIGREVLRLLKPFEMRYLATDPFLKPGEVADLGVELVSLETLMRQSDFVSVHCPLNAQTRGLIGERQLSWMKPTACFISGARGAIIDQAALYRTLAERRIRGAAMDVFEKEPPSKDEPLLKLDNVVLSPHTLCWTDECFLRMGESAIQSVLSVLSGEIPPHVVNREVLERPGMRAKLEANRARWLAILRETKA